MIKNGNISWKLFLPTVALLLGIIGWQSESISKDVDKNEDSIKANTKCLQNVSTSQAVIKEQIQTIKENLKTASEDQRKRDILILEKLNEILNGQ